MPSKELVNLTRTLIRTLALPENHGADLKELIDDAFQEVSDQTLTELSILEQTVKSFTGVAPQHPTTTAAPKSKSDKRMKTRPQSAHEKEIRELLSYPESVIELAKDVGYGTVPSSNAATPQNMFKTPGLVNQVWKKRIGCGLNSLMVRQSLAGTLVRTLGQMEKAGKAKRIGTSRATRWVLIEK